MLRLRIADLVIGVQAGADGPPAVVDGAAAAFTVSEGIPDVVVTARWGALTPAKGARVLFHAGGLWQLHEQDGRLLYSFNSPVFPTNPYRQASFDRNFQRGIVTLDRDGFRGRPPAFPLEYPLDELIVINRLVADDAAPGVELHGCGIVDEGGAGYLFAGQSGSGKSTIARLWSDAGATVISDDRVVVRARAGGFMMYGTPWHGDAEFAEPVAVPLTRIVLLRQAPRHRLVPLGAAHAAALLFSCAFPVFHSAEAIDRTLSLLRGIVQAVPVDALEFAPVRDVTSFVRLLRGADRVERLALA
jgi:hypothetical protein